MSRHKTILIVALTLAALTIVLGIGNSLSSSTPIGLATFVDIDSSELENYFENGKLKPEFIDELNENIDEVPPFVLDMFAEGKTNFTFITSDNEEMEFNVVIEEEKLVGAQEGHAADAEALVKIDEETIKKIAASEEPIEALTEALSEGTIKYEPISTSAKLKALVIGIISFIVGIIMGTFSFFRGIVGG